MTTTHQAGEWLLLFAKGRTPGAVTYLKYLLGKSPAARTSSAWVASHLRPTHDTIPISTAARPTRTAREPAAS